MTAASTLEVRPPSPPIAKWELPADLAGLRADAFTDALWAVAVGSEDALDEHRAAAAERARHALPEHLLAGARQKLGQAQRDVIALYSDPTATAADFEMAYKAHHAAAETVAVFREWRPNASNIPKPAAQRLAAGIQSRIVTVGWWAIVGVEHKLFSEEQLRQGCARSADLRRPALERAQQAGALLGRTEDYTGSQERLKNARSVVEDCEAHLALARVHAGISTTTT